MGFARTGDGHNHRQGATFARADVTPEAVGASYASAPRGATVIPRGAGGGWARMRGLEGCESVGLSHQGW